MVFLFCYALLGLACFEALIHNAAAQKVVRLPLKKREGKALLKKRDPFAISMQNYIPGAEYYVTALIGTPPQEIDLVVDTGSSDTWMFGPNSCNHKTSLCEGGEFDISASSTAQYVPGGMGTFKISYVSKGSGVVGDYITDQFGVGGVTVDSLTMAVATRATYVPSGIMGIGLSLNEASVSQGIGSYPNFPELLVSQDKIRTNAYSLYLDDIASSTGMVVFGGYDEAKFRNTLVMLPIQPDPFDGGRRDTFVVSWTSLGISETGGKYSIVQNGEFQYPANLDTGTTLTYVPSQIYAGLADYFNVIPNGNGQPSQVDCDFGKRHPGQLIFGFGGPDGVEVAVEFDELIVPYYSNGYRATSSNGAPLCALGIIDAGNNPILLGQTFLRSAYILYDLDNLLVGIAQTVFDITRSQVIEYSGKAGASRIKTIQGVALTGDSSGRASAVPTEFAIATVPYPSGAPPDSFPTRVPIGPTGHIPLHVVNDGKPKSPSGSGGGSISSSSASGGSKSSKSGVGSTGSSTETSRTSRKTGGSAKTSTESRTITSEGRTTRSKSRTTTSESHKATSKGRATTSRDRTTTSRGESLPTESRIGSGNNSGGGGRGGDTSSGGKTSTGGRMSGGNAASAITPAFSTAIVSIFALFSAMALL